MMSEEKAKEDMLLWMDVETTGLDPDHDRILEVEMRCTDMRGVRCVGGFRRVIGLKGRKASVTDGNIKAWRMHCANGLLEAAGWDVKPEEETPAVSAHRTDTCLDRDIRQYARIIRHLSDHPVRYVATKAAR
jgi:oligoribonuclease (3'-5' exoribonuclease)